MKNFILISLLISTFLVLAEVEIVAQMKVYTTKEKVITEGQIIYRKTPMGRTNNIPIGVINSGTSVLEYRVIGHRVPDHSVSDKVFNYCGGGTCVLLEKYTSKHKVQPNDTVMYLPASIAQRDSILNEGYFECPVDTAYFHDLLETKDDKSFLAHAKPDENRSIKVQLVFENLTNTSEKLTFYLIFGPQVVGINLPQQETKQFTVYPNPVADVLHFKGDEFGIEYVELFNYAGQTIGKQLLSGETTIDVSSFSAGVYFVKIISNGRSEVHSFVKQ